ncbi:PREDICTED: lysozyme-like protein 4 isoform X2 [Chinchilla lanigera]|uniref:Lysozyme like 4 n=2 Tax=Chinchilla lanigera TaxID=34839 RepID=A0A8C2W3K2_CHILA|nr:PREDICTED: lysozyme-like protein 4 isoform X2 [Chinchilla lanigera]
MTMRAPALLFLLGCLVVPGGARILGRCEVARKLHEGGLDYFEGYSLANWVCLAYFESKFNPSAVYENEQDDSLGYGLFQIRDNKWCEPGRNLCHVACSELLNPNLKETIKCVKKIVKGKRGLGAWPSWSLLCRYSDTLARWLDGCKL